VAIISGSSLLVRDAPEPQYAVPAGTGICGTKNKNPAGTGITGG